MTSHSLPSTAPGLPTTRRISLAPDGTCDHDLPDRAPRTVILDLVQGWDGNPHLISRLIELLVRYRRIGAARVALRNVPRQLWWVLRRHQLDMLFIVDPDPEPTRAC
ncbi:MAG: hypothetical protein ACOCZK_01830 [Planctomycetota bacterium]